MITVSLAARLRGGGRIGDGFCVNDPGGKPLCITAPISFVDVYTRSRSRRRGGVHAGFGDGSVHLIKDSISPVISIG